MGIIVVTNRLLVINNKKDQSICMFFVEGSNGLCCLFSKYSIK